MVDKIGEFKAQVAKKKKMIYTHATKAEIRYLVLYIKDLIAL